MSNAASGNSMLSHAPSMQQPADSHEVSGQTYVKRFSSNPFPPGGFGGIVGSNRTPTAAQNDPPNGLEAHHHSQSISGKVCDAEFESAPGSCNKDDRTTHRQSICPLPSGAMNFFRRSCRGGGVQAAGAACSSELCSTFTGRAIYEDNLREGNGAQESTSHLCKIEQHKGPRRIKSNSDVVTQVEFEPPVLSEKLFGPKVDVCKVEQPKGVRRLRPNHQVFCQVQSELAGPSEKMFGSRVEEDHGARGQRGSSLFSNIPSRSLTITPETVTDSSFSAHVKRRNVDEVKRITDRMYAEAVAFWERRHERVKLKAAEVKRVDQILASGRSVSPRLPGVLERPSVDYSRRRGSSARSADRYGSAAITSCTGTPCVAVSSYNEEWTTTGSSSAKTYAADTDSSLRLSSTSRISPAGTQQDLSFTTRENSSQVQVFQNYLEGEKGFRRSENTKVWAGERNSLCLPTQKSPLMRSALEVVEDARKCFTKQDCVSFRQSRAIPRLGYLNADERINGRLHFQARTRQSSSPSQERTETSKWSVNRLATTDRKRKATFQQNLETEGARASVCSVGVLNSSVSPFQNMPAFARPDEAHCTGSSGARGSERKREDVRQLANDVISDNTPPAAISPWSILRDPLSRSKVAKGEDLQNNPAASDRPPRPKRKELQGTRHPTKVPVLSPPQLRPGEGKALPTSSPQMKSVMTQDTEHAQLHRLVTASNDTALHEQGHRAPRITWVETTTGGEKCEYVLKRSLATSRAHSSLQRGDGVTKKTCCARDRRPDTELPYTIERQCPISAGSRGHQASTTVVRSGRALKSHVPSYGFALEMQATPPHFSVIRTPFLSSSSRQPHVGLQTGGHITDPVTTAPPTRTASLVPELPSMETAHSPVLGATLSPNQSCKLPSTNGKFPRPCSRHLTAGCSPSVSGRRLQHTKQTGRSLLCSQTFPCSGPTSGKTSEQPLQAVFSFGDGCGPESWTSAVRGHRSTWSVALLKGEDHLPTFRSWQSEHHESSTFTRIPQWRPNSSAAVRSPVVSTQFQMRLLEEQKSEAVAEAELATGTGVSSISLLTIRQEQVPLLLGKNTKPLSQVVGDRQKLAACHRRGRSSGHAVETHVGGLCGMSAEAEPCPANEGMPVESRSLLVSTKCCLKRIEKRPQQHQEVDCSHCRGRQKTPNEQALDAGSCCTTEEPLGLKPCETYKWGFTTPKEQAETIEYPAHTFTTRILPALPRGSSVRLISSADPVSDFKLNEE